MDTSKVDSMLSAQSLQQDPFTGAQAQFQQSASVDQNSLMQGGTFDQGINNPQQSLMNSQQPTGPNPQNTALNGLFQGASNDERMQFEKSPLPGAMQQQGLDPKDLALSPLGRVQLINKLQEKYGSGYQTNPDAQKLVGLFDQSYTKNSSQTKTQALQGAQRTLAELYK